MNEPIEVPDSDWIIVDCNEDSNSSDIDVLTELEDNNPEEYQEEQAQSAAEDLNLVGQAIHESPNSPTETISKSDQLEQFLTVLEEEIATGVLESTSIDKCLQPNHFA